MKELYPHYDVFDKWNSPSFDAKTRQVLADRVHSLPPRRFFGEQEWRLLEAITAQLLPQPERSGDAVPITPWIDAQLFEGMGEGFRHDNMPPIAEAWRLGLAAIEGEARHRHACSFVELDAQSRDALLHAVANDEVDRSLWSRLPAQRFFVDILLKTAAGVYYSHPAAWNEIGFGGPASPRGYVRLGFNQRDPWEAKEIR